ncbi:MAG TPA: alpha/beta fold hydrolase [Solirubrobacterales bacterium]|nr:alpha/beta fold hydrolase [Solirubrobacterales bacterium]
MSRPLTQLLAIAAIAALALTSPIIASATCWGGGGGGNWEWEFDWEWEAEWPEWPEEEWEEEKESLERDPILFVHGWNGSSATWSTMLNWFHGSGWPYLRLHVLEYDSSQSNVITAAEVEERVWGILGTTGAKKVDLVTHSMGALSTRYFLKNFGGTSQVDDWVSLGGPNHGTNTAEFCFSAACQQMWIGSTFLSELNAGDETPGAVNYRTWWSECDFTVNPDSSVWLSGASANTKAASCPSHSGLHEDYAVYQQVKDFVK